MQPQKETLDTLPGQMIRLHMVTGNGKQNYSTQQRSAPHCPPWLMSLFLSPKTTKNHSKALNTQCPKDRYREQMWIPNLIRQFLSKQMGDLFKRGLHGSEGLKKIILQVFFFFFSCLWHQLLWKCARGQTRQARHGSSLRASRITKVG